MTNHAHVGILVRVQWPLNTEEVQKSALEWLQGIISYSAATHPYYHNVRVKPDPAHGTISVEL